MKMVVLKPLGIGMQNDALMHRGGLKVKVNIGWSSGALCVDVKSLYAAENNT